MKFVWWIIMCLIMVGIGISVGFGDKEKPKIRPPKKVIVDSVKIDSFNIKIYLKTE